MSRGPWECSLSNEPPKIVDDAIRVQYDCDGPYGAREYVKLDVPIKESAVYSMLYNRLGE